MASSDLHCLALRPALPMDEAFLFGLYSETRKEEMMRSGLNPADQETFLRLQFMARRDAYRTNFPHSEQTIVLLNGAPAGTLWVSRATAEIRVVDIAICRSRRGEGIGRQLLQALIDEARKKRQVVRLHVLKGNQAISLYQRLGFVLRGGDGAYLGMEWRSPRK